MLGDFKGSIPLQEHLRIGKVWCEYQVIIRRLKANRRKIYVVNDSHIFIK